MTFWQFLQQRAKVSGALGDFARDAIADPEFPRGRRRESYAIIMEHLERQYVSDDAEAAFMRDWCDWFNDRSPDDDRRHRARLLDRVRGNVSPKVVSLAEARRQRHSRGGDQV